MTGGAKHASSGGSPRKPILALTVLGLALGATGLLLVMDSEPRPTSAATGMESAEPELDARVDVALQPATTVVEEVEPAEREVLPTSVPPPLPPPVKPPPKRGERVYSQRLTGRVTSLGEPVDGALVLLVGGSRSFGLAQRGAGFGNLPLTEIASRRTGKDGSFDFGRAIGCVDGEASLFIASSEHPNRWFKLPILPESDESLVAQRTDGSEQEPSPPEFDIGTGDMATGTLVWDRTNEPLEGVRVVALQTAHIDKERSHSSQLTRNEGKQRLKWGWDLEPMTTTTDEFGRFELRGVVPSTVQLVLDPGLTLLDGDIVKVGGGFDVMRVGSDGNAMIDLVGQYESLELPERSSTDEIDRNALLPLDSSCASLKRQGEEGSRSPLASLANRLVQSSAPTQSTILAWRGVADRGPRDSRSLPSVLDGDWPPRSIVQLSLSERTALCSQPDRLSIDVAAGSSTSWLRWLRAIRPGPWQNVAAEALTDAVVSDSSVFETLSMFAEHPLFHLRNGEALTFVDEFGDWIEEPVRLTLRPYEGPEVEWIVEPGDYGTAEFPPGSLFEFSHFSAAIASDDQSWPRPFVERLPMGGKVQQVVVSRPAGLTVRRPRGLEGAWACDLRSTASEQPNQRFEIAADEVELVIDVIPPGRWYVGRGSSDGSSWNTSVVVLGPGDTHTF
ncbi:MAG: hypothetical protein ACYSWX_01305 [Planctomycetota bacterium]|jgi:hypothetical protein